MRSESKWDTTSQMISKFKKDYIKEREIKVYIDDLWKRIGEKLKSKGAKSKNIKKAIEKVRKNR